MKSPKKQKATPEEIALHDEVCVLTLERLLQMARDRRAPVRARATANKHLRFEDAVRVPGRPERHHQQEEHHEEHQTKAGGPDEDGAQE